MSILTLQTRIRELGRIRIGDKSPNGAPRKLTTFRLTSFDKAAIEAAAVLYGGQVIACKTKDLQGQWECTTHVSQLPFFASPAEPSQYFESWTAAACTRRCDGCTELLSGAPCMCDPDNRECKPTTRLPVILPDIPGIGVWRLESHGFSAANELVPTFELLRTMAGRGQHIEAILGIEDRRGKVNGQVVRFCVPVIRTPFTPRQLLMAQSSNAAALADPETGELPIAPANELPQRQEPHEVKPPNPRGAAFAIMHEMGLPNYADPHKDMFRDVLGKYLQKKGLLDTLSTITDEEWARIAQWLRNIQQGKLTMPAPFAEWLAKRVVPAEDEYDPFADTDEVEQEMAAAVQSPLPSSVEGNSL